MALATPIIAATYAEIALKGRNRNMFMRKLINNLRISLKGEPLDEILHVESRVLVYLSDASAADRVAEKMRKVFGLVWVSPVVPIPRAEIDDELMADLEAEREPRLTRVCEVACELTEMDRGKAATFKVATRRSDKTFALKSPEVSMAVGAAVHQKTGLPGLMAEPDFVVNVLVLKKDILGFHRQGKGLRGLARRSQRPGHGSAQRRHRFPRCRLVDDAPGPASRVHPFLFRSQPE